MARCPNCGQETLRTKDWACQLCGYPLLTGFFRRIDKTYREIQREREQPSDIEEDISSADEEDVVSSQVPETDLPSDEEPETDIRSDSGAESSPEPVSETQSPVSEELKPDTQESPEPEPENVIITPPPVVEETKNEADNPTGPAAVPETEPPHEVVPPQAEAEPVIELPAGLVSSSEETRLPTDETEPSIEQETADETTTPVSTEVEKVTEPVAESRIETVPQASETAPVSLDSIVDGTLISVDQLDTFYRADRAAIHGQLNGKMISVKGLVEKVVIRDHLDVRYVLLKSAGKTSAWNVRCSFDRENISEMGRLSEGQSVTVKGTYDGASKNILFKDCVLVA